MVVGWRRIGRQPLRVVHVYLPRAIMAAAEDEFRLAGRAAARMPFLTIRDLDPVIHAVTGQLLDAIDGQQPDIYAQSAAHFLAAHLQTVHRFTSAGDMRAVAAPADLRIARVVDRMRSELERPLGIDELAREACVSPFHFSRLFKAATGIAPARYLTELRMKRAVVLLENEADMPIGTVAVACGYSNAAAFTTAFRRWSGITPRGWRSRVRGPTT
jgi:AraC family transcriptional regulator